MLELTRRLLAGPRGLGLAALIAVAYGALSMAFSGMVHAGPLGFHLGPTPAALGAGLTVGGLGLALELPLVGTALTALVAGATGVGLAVAILVSGRIRSALGGAKAGSATAGAIAALTPAMIALVTLGACCSTVAASALGFVTGGGAGTVELGPVGLSGSTLGLIQLGMLGGALLAQERLLGSFADLLRLREPDTRKVEGPGRRWTRQFLAGPSFRLAGAGSALLGSLGVGALLAPAPDPWSPGGLVLGGLLRGDLWSVAVVLSVLLPAALALAGSRRTLAWLRPALRGGWAALGESYGDLGFHRENGPPWSWPNPEGSIWPDPGRPTPASRLLVGGYGPPPSPGSRSRASVGLPRPPTCSRGPRWLGSRYHSRPAPSSPSLDRGRKPPRDRTRGRSATTSGPARSFPLARWRMTRKRGPP